jgi:DNA-binding beta-propeller fold protein YncE
MTTRERLRTDAAAGRAFAFSGRPYWIALVGLLAAELAIAAAPQVPCQGCPRLPTGREGGTSVEGVVRASGQALAGLAVTLYAGGPSGSRVLGTASTDGDGRFRIRYRLPANGDLVYVVAQSGAGPVALMTVLGADGSPPSSIFVNELTTVAGVWPLIAFLDGVEVRGNAVGLRSAASNPENLIDPTTGAAAAVALDGVNVQTTTVATIYSLGSLLGACASDGDCTALFALATSPSGALPSDTLAAAQNIARQPWRNVKELFDLLGGLEGPYYAPTLRYVPTAWTLSLVYTGGGLDAPGGVEFDANGFVWTNNNFLAGSQSFLMERGFAGLGVTKLTPNGRPLSPRFGYQGAGILGAGFGIAIDQRSHIWVGNFAGNNVSELDAEGRPVSDQPYTAGGTTEQVQGIAVDQAGNVWAANFGGDSVSFFPAGNPDAGETYSVADFPKCGFDKPFGLAIDGQGRAWVANQFGATIVRVDRASPEKCPDGTIPVGDGPMGIALDPDGNVWTANDGSKNVTLHEPASGRTRSFSNDPQMVGPWGIAVDGAGNVWVADFFGTRVVQLCGVPGRCPSGLALGDPITPPSGYGGAGGMQHITDIAVDQAGNVWVTNNNNDQRLCDVPPPLDSPPSAELEKQSMACGGNGVLVLFGVAAPIEGPLIGPPVPL